MATDNCQPLSEHADWVSKLDQVKERAGLTTDRELAQHLSISPQYLSSVRKGIPFSSSLKLKLMDRLGYQLTRDALLLLLPVDVASMVRDIDQRRSIKRARKKSL